MLDSLTITPLPADRSPVPVPPGVKPLAFFTLQTHGARVEGPPGSRVRITYPNTMGLPPGSAVDLWTYDANRRGWAIYGRATVSADGRSVTPNDPVLSLSASGSGSGGSGSGGSGGSGGGSGSSNCLQLVAASWLPLLGPLWDWFFGGGDPVDLGTGLFQYDKTDLVLPDVIPLVFKRTYRSNDSTSRAFGIGASHAYDLVLVGDYNESYADLVMPNGGAIHYTRRNPGTDYTLAIFDGTGTAGAESYRLCRTAHSERGWSPRRDPASTPGPPRKRAVGIAFDHAHASRPRATARSVAEKLCCIVEASAGASATRSEMPEGSRSRAAASEARTRMQR